MVPIARITIRSIVAALIAASALLAGRSAPIVGEQTTLQPTIETPTVTQPMIESHVQPTTFDIYGVLTLHDSRRSSTIPLTAFRISGIGCSGIGGFSDIIEHASVTVYDGRGNAVAAGVLGAGVVYPIGDTVQCKVSFGVDRVPSGSSVYQIEITHRGKISVSAADAQQTVLVELNK